MRTFRRFKSILLLLIVIGSCLHLSYGQDEKKERQASETALIKNLIDSQDFDFVAQSVLPARGAIRQLSSLYDIAISKDSVVSYLPYFGRAYTVPYNSTEGGFKFTSTKFEYSASPTKKNGWDILIKPKDYNEVQELSFRIFNNGYASLRIVSLNREPISFQGYITERKQKK